MKRENEFYYCFNPQDNGGEAFYMIARVDRADISDPYITYGLTLNSYGSSVTIDIPMWFSPEILRDCANKLESFIATNLKASD